MSLKKTTASQVRSRQGVRRLSKFDWRIGISWKPKDSEREVIRSLVVELEAHRALYMPYHAESGHFVVQSLLEIKKKLSATSKR